MRRPDRGTGSPVPAAFGELATWAAVLFAVTLVSISSVDPVETAVAACAACGGAVAARAIRRATTAVPVGGRGLPRAVAALSWTLPRGALLLARAALACPARGDAPGRRSVRLRAGAGWAALVLAASPDTCVIGADDESVDAHLLRRQPNAVERAVARDGEAS